MHGASGQRHRVVVVLLLLLCYFRCVPCRPLPVVKDEQDLGGKTRGGRCPRGLVEGVFLTNARICVHRGNTQTRWNKYPRCLMEKHLRSGCADTYPHGLFFPSVVHLFPSTQQRHDGVAQRPCATITRTEFRLILSGILLSL